MCRDSPDDEGCAYRKGKAVYVEYAIVANGLRSDYTMCNSHHKGDPYTCVPEWFCSCAGTDGASMVLNASGCLCSAWGGSIGRDHEHVEGRTDMKGLGEIAVQADWGTRGDGVAQPNCSALLSRSACSKPCGRGCAWDASTSTCSWAYSSAIALSEFADLVGGNWIAVERAGECTAGGGGGGGGGAAAPCYWSSTVSMRANATCVNNQINAAVAKNSIAAARCWADCGLSSDYPKQPSDCWVRCLQQGVLGRLSNGTGERIDPQILVDAFEKGLQLCKL